MPTYSIIPSGTALYEGEAVTFTINLTDVQLGSTLYWNTVQVSGVITTTTFTDQITSGSLTVTGNTLFLTRTTAVQPEEQTKSFRITLMTDSENGVPVTTSVPVIIEDSEQAPSSSSQPLVASGGFAVGDPPKIVIDSNGTSSLTNGVFSGNLFVEGDISRLNTEVEIGDKIVSLNTEISSDITALNGGIVLRGTTNKTVLWTSVDTIEAWTSNQNFNLNTGKAYLINNAQVINSTSLGAGVTSSSLTSVGTINTGVWQGTIISPQYGGTGINNVNKTITLGGDLQTAGAVTHSGAHSLTVTTTETTSVTLPVSGTLISTTSTGAVTNAMLANSSITVNGATVSLGGTVNTPNTTYAISAETATGGVNLALTDSSNTVDNVRFAQGTNVTIARTNADTITISSTDTTYSAGTGVTLTGTSFSIGQTVATNSSVTFSSINLGSASGATTGQLRASDDIIAFASSDLALKENISVITNSLDKIKQLKGVVYDWTDEYIQRKGGLDPVYLRKTDVGLIAQDVEKILPEIVAKRQDGYLAIKYDRIVALLVEAIKDLSSEIDELKKNAG